MKDIGQLTDIEPSGTGIGTTVPRSARIWTYWLGGRDNFAVDRMAADQAIAVLPRSWTWPGVPSERHKVRAVAMGQQAARMLLARIARPDAPREVTLMPPRLEVRGSTGPAPAGAGVTA